MGGGADSRLSWGRRRVAAAARSAGGGAKGRQRRVRRVGVMRAGESSLGECVFVWCEWSEEGRKG